MTLMHEISAEDQLKILILAQAAARIGKEYNLDIDYRPLDAAMDITACHANCPLQLDEMLAALETAHKSDVVHDLLGIRRHLDRDTCKLMNCFIPRYAQAEEGK